ncbi:hypothetical protein [Micromonospora chersina]|uniref:Uncharacterized protein n=1 Tax=Micromonospora chersina TaxID=47854 RepID=A0A1C6W0F0_9ACTN|nr:hypothetical protein [Micromonospora chersina]SCL71874.1 hypothetical protein GA0070603_6106 [Micromonospora chersina]
MPREISHRLTGVVSTNATSSANAQRRPEHPAGRPGLGLVGAAGGLRTAMVTAAVIAAFCLIPLLSRPVCEARQLSRA